MGLFSSVPFQIYVGLLPSALLITAQMTLGGTIVASAGGLVLALGSRTRWRPVVAASRALTYFVRSIPQPPALLVVYFTIEGIIGVEPPQVATVVALGIILAPWMGELFRAGIQAVPVGLVEAGRALGLSERAVQTRVVLPLAVRVMFPAFGQLVVGLMLSTSIASQLGAKDITGAGRPIIDAYFSTQLWFVIAAVYFLIAFPVSRALNYIERRSAISL